MTTDNRVNGPVHEAFGLTRASYLVVPRTVLQSMPLGWQARFVSLMREMSATIERNKVDVPDDYIVQRRGPHGRFVADGFADYRHRGPLWPEEDRGRALTDDELQLLREQIAAGEPGQIVALPEGVDMNLAVNQLYTLVESMKETP